MRWSVQGSHEEDEVLVARAQGGDSAAAEELMHRYKDRVLACARRYFLAGAEVDDLVQEGMIGLYKAIGSYSPAAGRKFKNFAYLCVTRRIVDVLRAEGRRREDALDDPDSLEGGDTPEDFLLDGESLAEFREKLLKVLSDFEYRVVTLYLDGLKYAQICEATGKPLKSVDNALARAKRKLASTYTEQA